MAGNATCHCGHVVEPRDPDPWEGRMDDYCYDCATNRCDCYPDECPVKYSQASSAAQPWLVQVFSFHADYIARDGGVRLPSGWQPLRIEATSGNKYRVYARKQEVAT